MTTDLEKERFLNLFGHDYGYPNAPKNIDDLRATEFKRLNDVVYLDHAGATLYSEKQLEDIFKDLNSTLHGNPHSQSNCSVTTNDVVGEARLQVLNFFNAPASEYRCIFTSGATAALKLIGETFPWSSQSTFGYSVENHNSVLGIREYALREGATAFAVDVEESDDVDQEHNGKSNIKLTSRRVQRRDVTSCHKNEQTSDAYNLFAFPSECNFSGLKFNLDLANVVKEDSYVMPGTDPSHSGRWLVLIDAAKGSATDPPDLSKYKADFVVVSFYKLFGYPTGIGALILREEAAKLLKKSYFSGGTVAASIADIDFYKRRDGVEEYFEDGTISFLSIASLHHGFKILNSLTMTAVARHTTSLANYVRNALMNLRHENGSHVSMLYGLNDSERLSNRMGPIVSFNLKRSDGSWFGHREVEKLASLSNIQLRTGCFCNPGACAKHLGLSHSDLLSNIEAGHICWDDQDMLHGKPTGAVRVSFGYMSTFEDARTFLKLVESAFVQLPPLSCQPMYLDLVRAKPFLPETEVNGKVPPEYVLKSITVYPIKSCAGFNVESWPLSSTGLLHDREWVLKSFNGDILTQKKVPEMNHITTLIDLKLGMLIVESPRCKEKLKIELKTDSSASQTELVKIYRQMYEVQFYPSEIDVWFSNAVGRPCTLVRNSASPREVCLNMNGNVDMCSRNVESKMNFVNEAQFLLISEESVADLNSRLRSKVREDSHEQAIEVPPMRFRPNLVFSGGQPYVEDGWKSIRIGYSKFSSLGGCNRCQMINMTSIEGQVQKSNEPLSTLASYRRSKGKIYFGVLLKLEVDESGEQDAWIRVGQEIFPETG